MRAASGSRTGRRRSAAQGPPWCRGNLRQDNLCGQTVPAKHVDCAAFTAAAARLSGLWDIVAARDAELAAGWDRRRARQLLLAFGAITHTVQDMPAHSTWVEVHLQAGLPVPRWDWRGAAVPWASAS